MTSDRRPPAFTRHGFRWVLVWFAACVLFWVVVAWCLC